MKLTLVATSTINVLSLHCLESLTITGAGGDQGAHGNDVRNVSCEAISTLLSSSCSLKELCVKKCGEVIMVEIVKGMCDNTALPLKRLEICGEVNRCSLSTTASRSLGQFITMSTTLQYFKICNVKISGQGLIALIAAIHNCSSLQEKRIEGLRLVFDDEWSDVSTEEVRASLTQLINDHPHMMDVEESLRDLSANEENYIKVLVTVIAINYDGHPTQLHKMNISDAGAVALAQALRHNSTLMELNLSNKGISDAGAVVLAQALHHNSTLQSLYLSNNSISDAGAVALAQALRHNSTLMELNLSNKGISDAGAVVLAQALHHNSTLQSLYLSNNSISDTGAVALAQALHHNSTLKELYLYDNDGIGEEGTHQLVQALTMNTSITIVSYFLIGGGLYLPKRKLFFNWWWSISSQTV